MSIFSNSDSDSLIGTLVDGRYLLEGELSRSTTSTTFSALDQNSLEPVVVRMYTSQVSAIHGPALLEQAQLIAQLSHRFIVRAVGYGTATFGGEQRTYVAQEQLIGGSLQDMIDRGRLLTPSQALLVGVDICRALDYAHRQGLVHYELRPSAIMFGADRKARLIDLGTASVMAEQAWADTTSISLERARYCAPEQAVNEPFDEKVDIYALALILVESVTGTAPFLLDSVVGTLNARVDKLFPVSADLGTLAAVLDKAGRSDPLERFSAAEMGKALVQAAPALPRPNPLPVVMLSGAGEAKVQDPTLDIFRPMAMDRSFSKSPRDMQGEQESQLDDLAISTPTDGPLIGRWIVAAVAVLAIITGGFFLFNALQKDSYKVPSLIGLDQGTATNQITEFGWTIVVIEEANDDLPVGSVIRTDPPVDNKLETGKEFTLIVSTGPPPVPLPEIVGLDAAAAAAALTANGLVLGTETDEYSENIAKGLVARWVVPLQPNLVAGTEVIKFTAVDIFISQGPAPRVIPNLVGMSVAQATKALVDVQLRINVADDQFSNDVPIGAVAGQIPAEGETLVRESSVTVSRSKGPDLVAVPQLLRLRYDQLSSAVVNAGFVLGKVTGQTTGFPIAVLAGGFPVNAGQMLPRGSTLDVVFYG